MSAAPLSWPFSWLSPTLPSAATAVPGLAAFSGRHCGAANLDGRRIPLDCMTSDYATIPWAQLPVVRHGFFDRDGYVGDTPLPALVDHRTSGAHGLVRDQGPAGTCTAVSFATAVDHAVGRALGRTVSVSAMHTWSRYATPRMSADYRNAPSGHAMVLAGYKRQTNGTYFLIQNSWGRRWGDGGFAWIHEATLRRNLRSAFVVDAKPRGAQNGLPAEPPIAPPACAAGQGPDSVTEVCAPFCPDGSPRTSGACPRVGRCPSGYVDVFGLCVMSAPVRPPPTDTASNVNVLCGAAGCTYLMAMGQHGCNRAFCSHSCPSPRYVLTSGPQGLSSTE